IQALAFAQDAASGIVMPVTLTGGLMVSERGKDADPAAKTVLPGFRTVLYPSLRLNSNWFVSSTIQVQSTPFFYYEAFYPERGLEANVQQLFVGYSRNGEHRALGVKV